VSNRRAPRYPKVVLVGGAPKSGKSTLARFLAARLDYDLVNTDDLAAAARAVASPSTHADLHSMTGYDYREYYLARPPDALWREALRMHRALWPAVVAVASARATWARAAVIEGWAILPELVFSSRLADTAALWLVVEPGIFEERVQAVPEFFLGARDEPRLIASFGERSRIHNEYLRAILQQQPNSVLGAAAGESLEQLCARALRLLEAGAITSEMSESHP